MQFLLDDQLKSSYETLFEGCNVNMDVQNQATILVQRMLDNQQRYQNVEAALQVPWYVVAVIHNMEAGQRFDCHLHNGDPLTARTVHVPKGRPLTGNPPFAWEASAIDALQLEGFDHWDDWSVSGICYKLEKYNGIGYRAHGINTPYLWGSSNNYKAGKYVQDGVFSQTAISQQLGAMVLLKMMQNQGVIELAEAV